MPTALDAPGSQPSTGRLSRRDWLLAGVGALCLGGPAAARIDAEPLFGSFVDLRVPASTPARTVKAVLAVLQHMHRRWNAWKPGELMDINESIRVGRAATVSPPMAAMIRAATRIERASEGLFNPAIGGLVHAWGFHAEVLRDGPPPDNPTVAAWTARAPRMSQLRLQGDELTSGNRWLQLDFGAYAKGVALDWALARLRAAHVPRALLNLGGNLAVFGPPESPWHIGVRDPFGAGLLGHWRTRDQEAVITSGRYERFRSHAGQRYAHIIDPVLGHPAQGFESVTVVHAEASRADAAATALLVAGPGRWERVAAQLGTARVLLVGPLGARHRSPAMAARWHDAQRHDRAAASSVP